MLSGSCKIRGCGGGGRIATRQQLAREQLELETIMTAQENDLHLQPSRPRWEQLTLLSIGSFVFALQLQTRGGNDDLLFDPSTSTSLNLFIEKQQQKGST